MTKIYVKPEIEFITMGKDVILTSGEVEPAEGDPTVIQPDDGGGEDSDFDI